MWILHFWKNIFFNSKNNINQATFSDIINQLSFIEEIIVLHLTKQKPFLNLGKNYFLKKRVFKISKIQKQCIYSVHNKRHIFNAPATNLKTLLIGKFQKKNASYNVSMLTYFKNLKNTLLMTLFV